MISIDTADTTTTASNVATSAGQKEQASQLGHVMTLDETYAKYLNTYWLY